MLSTLLLTYLRQLNCTIPIYFHSNPFQILTYALQLSLSNNTHLKLHILGNPSFLAQEGFSPWKSRPPGSVRRLNDPTALLSAEAPSPTSAHPTLPWLCFGSVPAANQQKVERPLPLLQSLAFGIGSSLKNFRIHS